MLPSEKLDKILYHFRTTKNKLGVQINKRQTLYDISSGKIKSFSPEVVSEILKVYPEINSEWLLYDKGEMLTDVSKPKSAIQQSKFADKTYKKEVTIIPAKAQLGLKSFLYPEEMMNELETKVIYVDQDYKGKYYEIECVGDSMDAEHRNAIRDGDTVLCREISKLHWHNPFHKNDWEFVFFHNEYGIIIKCIKEQNLETGDLILCSYNSDKEEYPDFTVNIKDCYAICNVVQVTQNRKKYYTL